MVGWEGKRTNNKTIFPGLKNNATASYQGPVKIELLKGVGLLSKHARWLSLTILGDPGAVSWVKRKSKWLSLQECPDRSFVLVNLAASTSFWPNYLPLGLLGWSLTRPIVISQTVNPFMTKKIIENIGHYFQILAMYSGEVTKPWS